MKDDKKVPSKTDVVVIGGGLSGTVAASELLSNGVSDVTILEARERVGGRLEEFVRPNGRVLMAGGEATGPDHVQLLKLAESLGVQVESRPAVQEDETGKYVRLFDGERIEESYPFENDPDSAAAYSSAVDLLENMTFAVPADSPWTAEKAEEWDFQTFGQWMDNNVESAAARDSLASHFAHVGDPHEVSLLYVLWFQSRLGGWDPSHSLTDRFVGGSAQIPLRLADSLQSRIFTSSPVRRIEHGEDGVVVHYDSGSIAAKAVIVTVDPGQASKIEFTPRLSPARDRLQSRWLAGHGAKITVVYDRPFWRENGLAGVGSGTGPFALVMDSSPASNDEGILTMFNFDSGKIAASTTNALATDPTYRTAVLDSLAFYFGEQAREPLEFYAFDWSADPWSQGCSSQLPTGVLSTVGHALREPVGRILWAGTETGDVGWMEGAVTAGLRSAREARELIAQ